MARRKFVQQCRYEFFTVDLEQILNITLVFLKLTLNT